MLFALLLVCIAFGTASSSLQVLVDLNQDCVNPSTSYVPFSPIGYHGNPAVSQRTNNLYLVDALNGNTKVVEPDGTCSIFNEIASLAPPGGFSIGFTIDKKGNAYHSNSAVNPAPGSNTGGVYKFDTSAPAFTTPVQIFANRNPFSLISGLCHDGKDSLFVMNEFGQIWRIDDSDNGAASEDFQLFADSSDYPELLGTSFFYGSPGADETNTNLLGAPLGSAGCRVDRGRNWLYVSNLETGVLSRIQIKRLSGGQVEAGELETVFDFSTLGGFGVEPFFLDEKNDVIYVQSNFKNFDDLTAVAPGETMWAIDISDLGKCGVGVLAPEIIVQDARLGAAGGVTTGRDFGTGQQERENRCKLYSVDSQFGNFFGWPNGRVASGEVPYNAPEQDRVGNAMLQPQFSNSVLLVSDAPVC